MVPMTDHGFSRFAFGLLTASAILLAACDMTIPTQEANPLLVTLPVATPALLTPTQAASPTPLPATSTPTAVPIVAPTPPVQGVAATRLLWQWGEVAQPTALAATGNRLAVLVSDGRFVWLDASSGRVEASAFLWQGILEGETLGEVYTDGQVAVVASREISPDPSTGLAGSRARLIVFGPQAQELWSLPEIADQRFYSAALSTGAAIVGMWPHGFEDNTLAAYELMTGRRLWEVRPAEDERFGYAQILHTGTRLYVLLDGPQGGGVACHDLRTGDLLWQWSDMEGGRSDRIVLDRNSLFALGVAGVVALDPITGAVGWEVSFNADPEAGAVAADGLVVLAPAPTVELGFRPGLIGLEALSGQLAWHSLNGLLANPLAIGDGIAWTIVKDFDAGVVSLSGLELSTGLEQVRVAVNSRPDLLYQLVAHSRRVYVLSDVLQAYGY